MKRFLLIVPAALLITNFSFAQWTPNANGSYTLNTNAGIGTTNPQGNLEVNNGSYVNGNQLLLSGLEPTRYYGVIGTTIPAGATILSFGTLSNFANYGQTLNLVNGNVGIGTTNPSAILDVNGVIALQNFASVSSQRSAINSYTNLFLGGAIRDNGNGTFTIAGDGGSNYFSAIRMDNGGNNLGAINFYNGAAISGSSYTINNANLNNYRKMTIVGNNVGIGTGSPDQLLTVNGTIHAKQVNIDLQVPAPDYVFNRNYKLRSLAEVNRYINLSKHLPEIPSAKTMEKKGINVTELNMQLLKKVEELTLYLIDKDKEISEQRRQIAKQQKQLSEQQKINQSLQQQINELAKHIKH